MKTVKINCCLSGQSFYGTPVELGPRGTLLLELDEFFTVPGGFSFRNLSMDLESGAVFIGEGVSSDLFMVARRDLPRLQEMATLLERVK